MIQLVQMYHVSCLRHRKGTGVSFKTTLTYLRDREGLTQEALAERLGLSRSAIGMYERGQREPDLKTLRKIAVYFHVDMNCLLDYSGDSFSSSFDSEDIMEKFLSLDPIERIKVDAYMDGLLSAH